MRSSEVSDQGVDEWIRSLGEKAKEMKQRVFLGFMSIERQMTELIKLCFSFNIALFHGKMRTYLAVAGGGNV